MSSRRLAGYSRQIPPPRRPKCKRPTLGHLQMRKNQKILNICSDNSKDLMQLIVQKTYNITDKKELCKFTNHSIRVGACCILQSQKESDSFIQNALRWKSDTWKMYCRNLTNVTNDLSETISCKYESALLANLQIN